MIQIKHKVTGEVMLEVEGDTLQGANLRGANLTGANLYRANLCDAKLYRAGLCDANLGNTSLYRANLRNTNLTGANLTGSSLYRADLRDANLTGTDLSYANLIGADLRGAKNIKSFRCGDFNRESYAVKHKDRVMFKIGCFWGTIEEVLPLIRDKYGVDSYYEKLVTIYNDMLMKD